MELMCCWVGVFVVWFLVLAEGNPQSKSGNELEEVDFTCKTLWSCFKFELEESSTLVSALNNITNICESQIHSDNGTQAYGWTAFSKLCRSGSYIDLLIGNYIEPNDRGDYHLCMLTGLGLFDSQSGIHFPALAQFIKKVKGRDQEKASVEKTISDCGKKVVSGASLSVMQKLRQFQDCLLEVKLCR
ncbi:unnamed protein product [Notodromas monacha]|uniref:Uncharacterized protein n=1 Tax=Notodromas monacha TaxID=399045 RepID=A0A7R9BEW7_9CRUS|nr:unnamed protein product [Notodromas monacha]CAG0913223.1 unnamed protein product [Notodromas monacha]